MSTHTLPSICPSFFIPTWNFSFRNSQVPSACYTIFYVSFCRCALLPFLPFALSLQCRQLRSLMQATALFSISWPRLYFYVLCCLYHAVLSHCREFHLSFPSRAFISYYKTLIYQFPATAALYVIFFRSLGNKIQARSISYVTAAISFIIYSRACIYCEAFIFQFPATAAIIVIISSGWFSRKCARKRGTWFRPFLIMPLPVSLQ